MFLSCYAHREQYVIDFCLSQTGESHRLKFSMLKDCFDHTLHFVVLARNRSNSKNPHVFLSVWIKTAEFMQSIFLGGENDVFGHSACKPIT